MKATKSTLPIATWLVLIFFAVYLFMGNLGSLSHPNWSNLNFYLSVVLVVFPVVLLVGKIISKESLTVIASLIIGIALLINLFTQGVGNILDPRSLMQFLLIALSFFFMSKGN